jgi:hypothetical protein
MNTLSSLAILAGGWISAMTGFALAAGHPCLNVNCPPAAISWERPARIPSLDSVAASPLWTTAGAAASLNWSFLAQESFPWRHAPVLRAASNDPQPAPLPAENSLMRRRADAALTDARVNVARCERVLRRGLPRRAEGRFRIARLNRILAENS